MVLRRESVLPRLAELFKGLGDVEVAILFGSIVRDGFTTHDIDLAVKFSRRSGLLDLGFIASQVAEAFEVSGDVIDVVDLEDANPVLLFKVLNEGVVIKGDENALMPLREKTAVYPDVAAELRMWSALDPNPKPDRAIITSRVEEIRRNAYFLKERILSKSPEELDYGEVLVLERAVHRIVEAMLDVCRHLVSVYSLGLVESYGEYARKLARAGMMPRELAEDVSKLTGLRNILIHRYLEVDIGKLYSAAREIVEKVVGEFILWIQELASKNS